MNKLRAIGLSVTVLMLAPASSVHAGPAVAAGASHVVVLTDAGTLWTWGSNGSGQLGDGTGTDRAMPVPITAISGVVAIAAGGSSTYAVKTDGTVWAWGDNSSGQLG